MTNWDSNPLLSALIDQTIVLSQAVHAVNVIIVNPNPIPIPLCPAPDILPVAPLVAEMPLKVVPDGPITHEAFEEWVCPLSLQGMYQFTSTNGKKEKNTIWQTRASLLTSWRGQGVSGTRPTVLAYWEMSTYTHNSVTIHFTRKQRGGGLMQIWWYNQ